MAPFLSSDPGRAASPSRGVDRLIAALERPTAQTRPPDTLRRKVLSRVEAEPARVETDLAGGIIASNPAFSALCGYAFTEIRGRKPGSFLQGPETDASSVEEVRQALRSGQAHECEMVNYHKDGSLYRVKLSIEPVHEEGRLTGFRAVAVKIPL